MKASSRGLMVAAFLYALSCYGTTVIVMRTATFKRMIDEHPTLKGVEFRMGEY